jgi:hypothetical protein
MFSLGLDFLDLPYYIDEEVRRQRLEKFEMFSLGLDFLNLPYYIDEEVRRERLEKNWDVQAGTWLPQPALLHRWRGEETEAIKYLRCSVWDWTSSTCPTTSMRRWGERD